MQILKVVSSITSTDLECSWWGTKQWYVFNFAHNYLSSHFAIIVKVVECESPLLSVVLLHGHRTLQLLQQHRVEMPSAKGEWVSVSVCVCFLCMVPLNWPHPEEKQVVSSFYFPQNEDENQTADCWAVKFFIVVQIN